MTQRLYRLLPSADGCKGNMIKSVKLRTGKLGRYVRKGHPWIYSRQLLKTDPSIGAGALVSVFDGCGKFLGVGYYNRQSDISVRIITFNNEPVDKALFDHRMSEALLKRKNLRDHHTDAYRAVFSESDGLPGLIVDVYAGTAVFQVMTLGMEALKTIAVESIKDIIRPRYIYEKSTSPFRKIEGLKNISMWHGEEGKPVIKIREGGAKFLVDIVNGHKTGFYLDQRKSRRALDSIVKRRTVLDLFSYTGAFAISAALYGASSVIAVDIKGDWHNLGKENARLNGVSDLITFIESDSFDFLEKMAASKQKFGMVIADPPSFLHNKESIASASKGYQRLNTMAMSVIEPGGILATFSCSQNMPNALFAEILKKSAANANKKITILKRCHQDTDHPIVQSIPETEYLKGYFLKIEDA